MKNIRISIRISEKLRIQLEQIIDSAKGKTISAILRAALEKFLDQENLEDAPE